MFVDPDAALKGLIPFVMDDANPLWDSGLLFITLDKNDVFKVELIGFYYESENDRPYRSPLEKRRQIYFDPVHKNVFDYLQNYHSSANPKVKWDGLALEVSFNGNYSVHYEFDGDEVFPDEPSEPDTITKAYLLENLRNCLAYNAPDNYEWIWETLCRRKEDDGKMLIEGDFFYSLNLDKSNPQKLEPGEYIFMYNVSGRLLDEFLFEKTKGWNKIRLEFSKEGEVNYYVLGQE